MIVNLIQFADSSSGIGALGLNGQALIIQIITFLLAFWALEHWAFKPILKIMERRRQTINAGVELGQQMQKDKADLEAKIAESLQKARSEADAIIAAAQTEARQVAKEAEDSARAKAEVLVKEADERIKQNTARAWREMEKDLAGLVSEAAGAIIEEKIDAKKDAVLIDKALNNSRKAAL